MTEPTPVRIKPKEKAAILSSLRTGVAPGIGLQHIQVGRKEEVSAILRDLDTIKSGGATVRFIIGKYGSGKTFFLHLARMLAVEKNFVVVNADITTYRRLSATGGKARDLYAELMKNMSTRAKRDGDALQGVIERWLSEINAEKGSSTENITGSIYRRLRPLQSLLNGYDFAQVLAKYVEGYQTQRDYLMANSLQWLRAEYSSKTEARIALGIRNIIEDRQIYEYLKLMASFVHMAGYSGLLVNLDEMGVLSNNLNNSQARHANYEMILRIVNDCLQGGVENIGFLFAGTNDFLDDRDRGVASYPALASRLMENPYAKGDLKDFSGPVIRLQNLDPEDFYVLLTNIRNVFALGDSEKYLIPDEGLKLYIKKCNEVLGAKFYQTPRDSVKGFVGFLSVVEQNPYSHWRDILNQTKPEKTIDQSNESIPGNDETQDSGDDTTDLATFRL